MFHFGSSSAAYPSVRVSRADHGRLSVAKQNEQSSDYLLSYECHTESRVNHMRDPELCQLTQQHT